MGTPHADAAELRRRSTTGRRRGRICVAAAMLATLLLVGGFGPSVAGAATTYQPVVIANGWSPSDVGTAAPLAASLGGSVLYANTHSLGDPTIDALEQLKPSQIILVGGTKALSEKIEEQLGRVAPNVPIERLAGTDRIDTAAKGALRALGRPVEPVADSGAAKSASTENLPSSFAAQDSSGNEYVERRLRVGTDLRPGVWQGDSGYGCYFSLGNDTVADERARVAVDGVAVEVHNNRSFNGRSLEFILRDGEIVTLQSWLNSGSCDIIRLRD